MRQSRAPRVARGLVAASVATFVALLSHVAAGGAMPGWLGVAVPWVLSVMVCTLLAGRRVSLPRLSISVAVSQLLFHGLFVLGAGGVASAASSGSAHVHGLTQMTALPVAANAAEAISAGPAMWVGHALAAAVTIAALLRGERAVVRLSAVAVRLRTWVQRTWDAATSTLLPLPVPRATVAATRAAFTVSSVPLRSALHHRGPPPLHVL